MVRSQCTRRFELTQEWSTNNPALIVQTLSLWGHPFDRPTAFFAERLIGTTGRYSQRSTDVPHLRCVERADVGHESRTLDGLNVIQIDC